MIPRFNINKKTVVIFIVSLVLASFGSGILIGRSQVVCKVCAPEDVDFSLFWSAWKTIQEKFVGRDNIDTQQMIYGAISGMINSLKDPYTIFLEPSDAKRFIEDVKGTFEGVGMEIGIQKEQLQVVSPLEGSPAQKAGLRAGDKILKINGTSTVDMTTEEAVNLIRGPKGTEVVLNIFRDDWKEPKDIKIIREMINVPSVKWEMKEGDIAYVELYQFSENASYEFRKAVIEILGSSAKKIVLDLRNNPGGYLEVSQEIAGWFLENGQVVTIEDFGGKQEQEIYKTNGSANLLPYPVVILINQGSASASEILAGALRDNRGIKLIGETSFGKGSVQEMQDLIGGSSLKITVARWLTPKGESISEKGLDPDIKVEITEEDYTNGRDPQLDKAIEIIKNLE
ncbi:MAG: S41 family peptidase, partial [Candidatus Nealsonbacteria bacterium]|nr:S41 family peptidase [Candidatus Nealsonbacteria bacterium]